MLRFRHIIVIYIHQIIFAGHTGHAQTTAVRHAAAQPPAAATLDITVTIGATPAAVIMMPPDTPPPLSFATPEFHRRHQIDINEHHLQLTPSPTVAASAPLSRVDYCCHDMNMAAMLCCCLPAIVRLRAATYARRRFSPVIFIDAAAAAAATSYRQLMLPARLLPIAAMLPWCQHDAIDSLSTIFYTAWGTLGHHEGHFATTILSTSHPPPIIVMAGHRRPSSFAWVTLGIVCWQRTQPYGCLI